MALLYGNLQLKVQGVYKLVDQPVANGQYQHIKSKICTVIDQDYLRAAITLHHSPRSNLIVWN